MGDNSIIYSSIILFQNYFGTPSYSASSGVFLVFQYYQHAQCNISIELLAHCAPIRIGMCSIEFYHPDSEVFHHHTPLPPPTPR